MPEQLEKLVVKSHVARDLLQTAGLFKNERHVVWEYVVNGLQYVDPGTNPVVRVQIEPRKKRVTVVDNGRGMNWEGLKNYFVMHGENIDRKEGKAGRGRFGTGKSAAFGIADLFRIITVRDGRRSCVELSRDDIKKISSGAEIPVRIIEQEVRCSQGNGTAIEIEQVHLKTIDQASIIGYIERHLSKWPKNVIVFVNNHECEVSEPPVAYVKIFTPQDDLAGILGAIKLFIKVSKRPLEPDERGVAIFSKEVWHETTLAGSEGREMSQYLFGELDVPKLEDDQSPITPFDVSRSMQLNPNNELVRAIYAFIGQAVEKVRRELVDEEQSRKASEEARKLAAHANEIAKVINEDFDAFRNKVAKVKSRGGKGVDLFNAGIADKENEDNLVKGSSLPVKEKTPVGNLGSPGSGGGNGTTPRMLEPALEPAPNDLENKGDYVSGQQKRAKPSGGFQVQFKNMGEDTHRAKYVSDERTIFLNLDHPQLVAARGESPVEDPVFRRLVYEIAFSEYAIALGIELAQIEGYYRDDFTDPIIDIRETINRLSRKSAHLYAVR